ncbi:DEDD exonuclease domain-containing protein [Corynebacterium sp. TAE3-ERU12]|uniref:DEDD exonuclease domain-containing protein n=1 Tax=Corynebacterium sp. TAE3-ERU12 TaxID=2849491 RepID=UPI001C48F48C|nr:DEDD exonuclease domain-containing protein [Corynebacterium sp. TAE3-ERU12]
MNDDPAQLSLTQAPNCAGTAPAPITAQPLRETTFVVVDLETTGLKPDAAAIIEIGAVRVRGGIIEDTFSQLVNPGSPIPPHISALTGITDEDVANAPQISTVLPDFLAFAKGATWVAHNASFDMGFLRANTVELGLRWPHPTVVDTLRLARQLLDREEVGSFRLGDLARYVGTEINRAHRAYDDARATVDVLHFLIERLGSQDVDTLDELATYAPPRDSRIAAKRELIAGVSHRPGVYIFRSSTGIPLYIGTASDLRRRVGQYFTGSDPRKRMSEMVLLADRVDTVECAHALDAEVREARMLANLQPPYNRQRKHPGRGWYLCARADGSPTIKRAPRIGAAPDTIGPFRSRAAAENALSLLADVDGDLLAIATELHQGGADLIGSLVAKVTELALQGRYRRAAFTRDLVAEIIVAADRRQRLGGLAAVSQIQAARPSERGGWEIAIIRHGRLAAAGYSSNAADTARIAQRLTHAAETVLPDDADLVLRGANPHEIGVVHEWLTRPEVRLGPIDGVWASPAAGAGVWRQWAAQAREARETRPT